MRTPASTLALVALVILGAACSSDTSSPTTAPSPTAAVCGDLQAAEDALASFQDVEISADGIQGLQDAVATLKTSLTDLKGSASSELSAQIAAVETSLASLETSLSALASGQGSIGDVAPELAATGGAFQALVAAVPEC